MKNCCRDCRYLMLEDDKYKCGHPEVQDIEHGEHLFINNINVSYCEVFDERLLDYNANEKEISYIAHIVSKNGIGFFEIKFSPLSMEIELTDDREFASQFDSIDCIKEMLKDSEFECDSISFIKVVTKTSVKYLKEIETLSKYITNKEANCKFCCKNCHKTKKMFCEYNCEKEPQMLIKDIIQVEFIPGGKLYDFISHEDDINVGDIVECNTKNGARKYAKVKHIVTKAITIQEYSSDYKFCRKSK